MTERFEVRQGDCYLIRIDEKLPDAKLVKPVGKFNMLAYGEVTNHAHMVKAKDTELYAANDNLKELAKKYGITDGFAVHGGLRVVRSTPLWHGTPRKDGLKPTDPDHTECDLPEGDYIVQLPYEYSDEGEYRLIAD